MKKQKKVNEHSHKAIFETNSLLPQKDLPSVKHLLKNIDQQKIIFTAGIYFGDWEKKILLKYIIQRDFSNSLICGIKIPSIGIIIL
jgi:hypothetical protein